jgi:hypothetical protein
MGILEKVIWVDFSETLPLKKEAYGKYPQHNVALGNSGSAL